jgi:PhnB protein
MFSDTFPGQPYQVGNNVHLAFVSDNKDEIQSVFDKLKEGGTVGMELQETVWSPAYGSLTDKFGIHWQVNYSPEACE